jgi:hypothetical protein
MNPDLGSADDIEDLRIFWIGEGKAAERNRDIPVSPEQGAEHFGFQIRRRIEELNFRNTFASS